MARNLIEYTKDISRGQYQSDYLNLTSCLHVKIETSSLTVSDIKKILRDNIGVTNLPTENTASNIKEYIYSIAEDLCNQPILDEIHIENKDYGYRRVYRELRNEKIFVNKKKVQIINNTFSNGISFKEANYLDDLSIIFEIL